jgi:iron(III) transport system substrate-binding protein
LSDFQKRFPFVKVENFQASSVPLSERFMTEKRAGLNRVDLFQQGTALELAKALDEGYIENYKVTSESKFEPESYRSGLWYPIDHATVVVYAYNTNLVTPEEAKLLGTWDGFWSPGLAGKRFALPSAVSVKSTGQWLYLMENKYGKSVWDKIQALKPKLYDGGVPATAALQRGEVAIAPISESQALTAWLAKAPIRWTVAEPALGEYQYEVLVKNAPHPNAARLLHEYILSRVGQEFFARLAYPSARVDVPDLRPVTSESWFKKGDQRKYFTSADIEGFAKRQESIVEEFKTRFLR